MDKQNERNPFIDYLIDLKRKDDRGALAHLKRGLGKPPGTVVRMHPYIVPWISGDRRTDDYYLIGSLFALHPSHKEGVDMGKAFRQIWVSSGRSESIEKRFMAMLDADNEDLSGHLRHAVSLARSKDVPIDWSRLFNDIRWWGHDQKWVQKRWANSFWKKADDDIVEDDQVE